MINALLNLIASHGDKGAVVPVSRFEDLKREMEDLKSETYHAFSDWMAETMAIPQDLGFTPRSLIAVITPSPKVILQFNVCGKPVHCVVPPQYSDGSKDMEVLQSINNYLTPLGFKSAIASNLPQKLLAVHCGLNLYGRNNISFNKEFGSYMRILSYVSDVPCNENAWHPVRRMEACDNCRACVAACPTKAIDPDDSVIDAYSCLTFKNEFPGDFPDWINKDAHNCIIGCMKCQDCCPSNAHNKNNIIKGVTFTEEETAELLGHKGDEPYSTLLAAKIESTGFTEFSQLIPRNFAVLLENITS